MKRWKDEDVRTHFRELFREMIDLKTNLAKDAEGGVWAFGAWYGERAHFRRGFGHWSEEVLDEHHLARLLPLVAYVDERPVGKDDKAWSEYYLRASRSESDGD